MKVFISSVRRGLEAERDYLPDLVRALGHQPLRFEDFGAQDLTSRGACLGGVQEADVYLLLLGPTYGGEMDDSRLSATEEEFNTAAGRGLPIYVFKKRDITPDSAQEAFLSRVGNYQEGRFWTEFADNAELGVAVTKALQGHREPAPPFAQQSLSRAVEVPWRREQATLPQPRDHIAVLEVHVVPIEQTILRPVATLGDLATRLATDARQQGFFGHGDALDINADTDNAWAIRNDPNHRSGWNEASTDPFAGVYTRRDGTLSAFQALPRDMLGSLVNEADLIQRLTVLLRHLTPYLPEAASITTAAAIDPADTVVVGDPQTVGNRNSGHMGFGRDSALRAGPADQIATTSLAPHLHEVARDLAARLIHALRSNGR
ncbi:DUF4062 domain-containing protein [Nocardioides seonyuensis]|uniref:DUF4062 domain-containing protein n=1 Tax=Nocardioides seonyuensis TaxID=2518371 RepID=A0A4P7IHX7_9ACTN|nr:DUF4062 domain-containing protein [Nocardioides seonyuensis]QBX55441.1 DUF4062 domain-containing protein [Nocardioides seonyuensis]